MTADVPKEALRSLFATLTDMPEARVIWDGEARRMLYAKGWRPL